MTRLTMTLKIYIIMENNLIKDTKNEMIMYEFLSSEITCFHVTVAVKKHIHYL